MVYKVSATEDGTKNNLRVEQPGQEGTGEMLYPAS